MVRKIVLHCALVLSLTATSAFARDVEEKYSISEALNSDKVKSAIYDDVALYWGDQEHPAVVQKFGRFSTSKRANSWGKSRYGACNWALASSIKALQDRAVREGGNALINISSNIKNHERSSATTYRCLAGRAMVNVALKGTVVTINK